MVNIETKILSALSAANQGMVTDELKFLQNYPYRDLVDWSLFPMWCRPNNSEYFSNNT